MTNLPRYLYQIYNSNAPVPAILKSREDARNLKRTLEADVNDSIFRIVRVTVDQASRTYIR